VPGEVGHLPARDPRRHLDDPRVPLGRDHLGEGDAVAQPERVHGVDGDALGLAERVRVERRGVDVGPADAEADPRRPQPIGERQQLDVTAARDHQAVELEPFLEALDDRLLGRRLGQRPVEVPLEVVQRVEPEDAALATRVGRLQHGREPDSARGAARLVQRPHRREARLRDAGVGEEPAHGDLVGHHLRGLGADPGQPEGVGDLRHDRDGPVGRDREHTVDAVLASNVGHAGDVREIDHLEDVGLAAAERLRVAIHRDDPEAALAGLGDRSALVSAGADEQDAFHDARS
jgi:hypothetical protein